MYLEYNKGILFVRLKGNLNHELSYKINTHLVPKILKQKIKYLVFNLYEVNDVDSFGLDALLNTKCAIRANKGKICLCEVSKKLSKIMSNIKMQNVENEVKAFDEIGVI